MEHMIHFRTRPISDNTMAHVTIECVKANVERKEHKAGPVANPNSLPGCAPMWGLVEVRDSRTGYFIPARYGMGSGQMEKLSARRRRRRRRRHLENTQI